MLTEGKPYNAYDTSLYDREIKRANKIAKPYPHTLSEKWDVKYLIPSSRRLPDLSHVEDDPEVTRLRLIQEIMYKAREKKKRKKRKKAA